MGFPRRESSLSRGGICIPLHWQAESLPLSPRKSPLLPQESTVKRTKHRVNDWAHSSRPTYSVSINYVSWSVWAVLVFKAAVPGAKEPAPLPSGPHPPPQPRVPLSGPQTCLLLRPAAPPCTAPPTRPGDPGSPPTASWPHLLRTPYIRVWPTAPRPRASLPPPRSPTGHGPTRTGWVGLAQPPGSHRELTAVSRLLTPVVSTPGGQPTGQAFELSEVGDWESLQAAFIFFITHFFKMTKSIFVQCRTLGKQTMEGKITRNCTAQR